MMLDEKIFLSDLIDLMDTEDEVSMDSNLKELEDWDSLSYVSFMAMAQNKYAKPSISREDVRNANIVRDLYNFVAE